MKKIFVDTNIIIDLVADRTPFSKFAIEIFDKAEKKKIQLFTSSHTIATTHYLLKKYIEKKQLRELLYNLLEYLQVVAIDQDIIKKGLKSKHKRF
jgi:predicted nucleic acid-binding protein